MLALRPFAALAMLAPLLVVAGCSSAGSPPCLYCDAGKDDLRPDLLQDLPASEDTFVDENEEDVADVPGDGTGGEAFHPATRDTPAGEAPRLTPLPDAGYALDDDFVTGQAPGWQIVGAPRSDAAPNDWSVILGDSGSVFSQGALDATTWHIAYATASIGPDQIIEAKLRPVDFYASDPAYVVALFGRYDPASDSGYFLALRGDGSAILRKRDHGTNASWTGGVDSGIQAGAWHTVRLEIIGNVINAFLDGTATYSVTDDNPLADGDVALGSFGATMEVERVRAVEP